MTASLHDPARLLALLRTDLTASPDPAFDRFASMVRTILGVPVALVSLVDSTRQFFPGAAGLDSPWAELRETPLSHSFCMRVDVAEPFVVPDARADDRVHDNPAIADLGVVGYAGMPLTDADGLLLGSLCAIDHEPRAWTPSELDILGDLAAACSDGLRLRIATNLARRRGDDAQFRQRRAEAAYDRSVLLLRASTALAAAGTHEDVVTQVRELVTGTLDPSHVALSLLDGDRLVLASAEAPPTSITASSPSATAARTGRPVLLPDRAALAAEAPDALATFDEMGWQSAASVPLPGPDGPIGALTFAWKQPNSLPDAEQAVLAALAGYVAQALRRVSLLEDRRTAAATMQRALLSPLPRHERMRMAARYVPAHHEDDVGGDWYDAISLDVGRLALVIGDVAGHSIAAAAAMSQYRSMLRTLLIDRQEPPSALLRRLEHTSRALGNTSLTTALLAYLDAEPAGGHVLTWANAGHPPPTVRLPDGQIITLLGNDPLLGAGRRIPRRNHTAHLPAGSTLLLHTDGLVETRNATFDEGMAGMHELLRRHPHADADELADLLIEHVRTTTGEDDVALLVLTTPSET